MTGALNMGTNKIANLAEPTNSQDAATKKYVDNKALKEVIMETTGVVFCDQPFGCSISISCPAGYTRTGGGCWYYLVPFNKIEYTHNQPTSDNGWSCGVVDTDWQIGERIELKAFVVCLKI